MPYISDTEKLQGTEFEYVNNCCKSIYVKLRLIEQCKYLTKEMIEEVASWIKQDVMTIQENCVQLLEEDDSETGENNVQ